ncbi:MAG: hypothetical protein KGH88_08495 [Thaumarchaeota archaeon]|nr:hypothetical protein [Nitrososphaerota archaeon]
MEKSLLPVIGPKNSNQKDRLALSQDATFYISNLEKTRDLGYTPQKDRLTYLFVIEGKVTVNDKTLYTRNAAEIGNEEILKIKAQQDTELILIDLPIRYMKNSIPITVEQN